MNDREKKLIGILLGVGLLVVSLLAYSFFREEYQKKELVLKKGRADLSLKQIQFEEAATHSDEIAWLFKNMPVKGSHETIRSELVTLVENAARKNNLLFKKRPRALPENTEDVGEFHKAVVKVAVNCRDAELYRWLVELQNPEKARSITWLKIIPQRDDATRIDCELEITQWFLFKEEEPMKGSNDQ